MPDQQPKKGTANGMEQTPNQGTTTYSNMNQVKQGTRSGEDNRPMYSTRYKLHNSTHSFSNELHTNNTLLCTTHTRGRVRVNTFASSQAHDAAA
jgi:hypothetical protein